MISPKNSLSYKSLEKDFSATKAHIIYPKLWFARFDKTEDEEPDEWFHPSDIDFPTELPCPSCDQICFDLVCSCGAATKHIYLGDPSCN